LVTQYFLDILPESAYFFVCRLVVGSGQVMVSDWDDAAVTQISFALILFYAKDLSRGVTILDHTCHCSDDGWFDRIILLSGSIFL